MLYIRERRGFVYLYSYQSFSAKHNKNPTHYCWVGFVLFLPTVSISGLFPHAWHCTQCWSKLRLQLSSSGQDGGIGRSASLPHTTKRRTTMNLKTKNNQNCQKIKLRESLTT